MTFGGGLVSLERLRVSYRLPPLNGLRAFEAAARHLSFKRAADELCVTPGAVSQQVKALEASLGVALFRRLPRGLVLTAEAETYLPAIVESFHAISEATAKIAPTLRGRRFRVGIAKDMAGYAAVRDLRKDRTLETRESDDLAELFDGHLDALLRGADGSHPGLHIDRVTLADAEGASRTVALFTLPALAGCHAHRQLLDLLEAAE